MDEIVKKAIDFIAAWLENWLGEKFGGWALNLLETGTGFYNQFVTAALEMLTTSPDHWNGGVAWRAVKAANTSFVALGSSLVVLFWMIGFCSESMDVRHNVRIETIIKSFLKIALAEYAVTQCLTIVQAFFGLVSYLASGILPKSGSIKLEISEEIKKSLEKPGAGMGFVCLLFAVVFVLAMVGCGMLVYVQAFTRFIKILVIVPYGALVSSTIAGNHMLTHSTVAYYKYILSSILEAVTMIMALKILSTVVGSGIVTLVSDTENGGTALGFIVQSILLAFVTLGVIKGSEQLTQRALGL